MVRQKRKISFLPAFGMLLISLCYSFRVCAAPPAPVGGSSAGSAAEEEAGRLIPLGNAVGVTLNMDGVLIVTVSEMKDSSGATVAPARDAGLKDGDLIKTLNGDELHSVKELTEALNEIEENSVPISVERDGRILYSVLAPAQEQESGAYKLAAWVKDAASGIGTITFCDPQTGEFGALGHSITDNVTGDTVPLSDGSIVRSDIVAVERGERGKPGELKGVFSEDKDKLGTILTNSECGLFGRLEENSGLAEGQALPIAKADEIHAGDAFILSNIEGDSVSQYSVEIQKISRNSAPHRDMVIRVTDPDLLKKTGGIVQGM